MPHKVRKLPRKGASHRVSWGHELPGKEPSALAGQRHSLSGEQELVGAQGAQELSKEAEAGLAP